MNNKWMVCLALALTGCGGSGLDGTWKGEAAGWSLTAELDENGELNEMRYFTGSMSSNKPACFTTGTAVATLTSTTAEIAASSLSSASTTVVVITGELSGNTFVGNLEVTSTTDECDVKSTAITLTRQ